MTPEMIPDVDAANPLAPAPDVCASSDHETVDQDTGDHETGDHETGKLAQAASQRSALVPMTAPPLGRVMDVPLTVTLRFGQRQLTVRELLELNTGSLVELDQEVEEPVNLMLGERVIARGEVVIVDGNYGMRVLEVVEHPMQHFFGQGHA